MTTVGQLTIVSLSSEIAPFSKAGGLGDVARALPKALARLHHRVVAIAPLVGTIDTKMHHLKKVATDLVLPVGGTSNKTFSLWRGELAPKVPVYFVDIPRYFSQRGRIYGSRDENTRFYLFDLAALATIEHLKLSPDIIQCHDWHTGLVPLLLARRRARQPLFRRTASVFTIHNLNFQFGHDWWRVAAAKRDNGRDTLPTFASPALERVNFAKRGILNADVVNTVSEQYAQEILTKELGQDLHRILTHNRSKLFGIVNGIDYFEYNPSTDPGLTANYDWNSLDKKVPNKLALQKFFRLPRDSEVPVVGMVSRITEQKGFDLLFDVIDPLMRLDVQIAVLGGGDRRYEGKLRKINRKYPKKFGTHLTFDQTKATMVYAGSDMFLMPSRFEPCGLGQLISLRYGSVPIVRATGGLVDTITNFSPKTDRGNGFVFKSYDSRDLLVAVVRASALFYDKQRWVHLVWEGMKQSFSWEIPAKKYITLFKRALRTARTRRR